MNTAPLNGELLNSLPSLPATTPPASPSRAALLRRRRAAAPTPTPTPTQTFYGAMVAWYHDDGPALTAVPGGLVDGEAAPNQAFPYARYWGLESQEPASLEDEEVEVSLSFYAPDDNAGVAGDSLARDAGNAFKDRLLDPVARGEWPFLNHGAAWRESGCQWIPPGKLQVVGKAAGGKRVWRYDLWFKFFLTDANS